jgi:hypothetical protein
MINLVECEMTANEANDHQGAPLHGSLPDDVLESMWNPVERKSNDESPFSQHKVITQEDIGCMVQRTQYTCQLRWSSW